jgi:hypothetical protein
MSMTGAAQTVEQVLDVRLEKRVGSLRGTYYRWSDERGADVLVQANLCDERGASVDGVPGTYRSLVYATGLDDEAYGALDGIRDLHLLDADLVLLN